MTKIYPKEIEKTENLIDRMKKDIGSVEPKGEGEDKFVDITLNGENSRQETGW